LNVFEYTHRLNDKLIQNEIHFKKAPEWTMDKGGDTYQEGARQVDEQR